MKRLAWVGALFKAYLPRRHSVELRLSLTSDIEVHNLTRMKDQRERSGTGIRQDGPLDFGSSQTVLLHPPGSRWTMLDLRDVVDHLACGTANLPILLELDVIDSLARGETLQVLHQFLRSFTCLMQDLRQRTRGVASNCRHRSVDIRRTPTSRDGLWCLPRAIHGLAFIQDSSFVGEQPHRALLPWLSQRKLELPPVGSHHQSKSKTRDWLRIGFQIDQL